MGHGHREGQGRLGWGLPSQPAAPTEPRTPSSYPHPNHTIWEPGGPGLPRTHPVPSIESCPLGCTPKASPSWAWNREH